MTVEVYKANNRAGSWWTTGYFDEEMFDLATFFSGSVNFDIIDSYSNTSTPQRFNGDPITNGSWTSVADIDENDAWIVIRCITSIHSDIPDWECKIQCTRSTTFADVSDPTGVKYPLHHGSTNVMCFRMGPVGGWDFAGSTPDFNSVGLGTTDYSTENHLMWVGPDAGFGTGNVYDWFIVADAGGFCRFNKINSDPFYIISFGGYMGDYIPIDNTLQLFPRCFIGSGNETNFIYSIGNSRVLCEDQYTTGNNFSVDDTDPGIAFYDHTNSLVEVGYSLPGHNYLFDEYTNPNNLGSSRTIDTAPYTPMPIGYGSIGTIPLISKGRGIGPVLLDSGNWISTADNYCLYIKWDGSTSIY